MIKAGIPWTWARNKQNHQLWLSLRNSTASNLPVDTAMIHGCPWNSGFRTHDKCQQDGGMQGHVLDRRSNCAFIRNNGKAKSQENFPHQKNCSERKIGSTIRFRSSLMLGPDQTAVWHFQESQCLSPSCYTMPANYEFRHVKAAACQAKKFQICDCPEALKNARLHIKLAS